MYVCVCVFLRLPGESVVWLLTTMGSVYLHIPIANEGCQYKNSKGLCVCCMYTFGKEWSEVLPNEHS